MKLGGKSVLLTGATGGLGRAIAHALADRGAGVILISRKQPDLDELAASRPGSGHRTIVSDLITRLIALRVNLDAPVHMARELVPRFQERGSGHLVFTVAPMRQRIAGWLAANTPELSSRLSARTAAKFADRIAAGQTDKR